jgi:hypothetical protein
MGDMPELPEVEALAAFLRENAVGHVLARADLASVQAIKTFDPPPSALRGGSKVVIACTEARSARASTWPTAFSRRNAASASTSGNSGTRP